MSLVTTHAATLPAWYVIPAKGRIQYEVASAVGGFRLPVSPGQHVTESPMMQKAWRQGGGRGLSGSRLAQKPVDLAVAVAYKQFRTLQDVGGVLPWPFSVESRYDRYNCRSNQNEHTD